MSSTGDSSTRASQFLCCSWPMKILILTWRGKQYTDRVRNNGRPRREWRVLHGKLLGPFCPLLCHSSKSSRDVKWGQIMKIRSYENSLPSTEERCLAFLLHYSVGLLHLQWNNSKVFLVHSRECAAAAASPFICQVLLCSFANIMSFNWEESLAG